jgi:hypothetical protein
VSVIDTATNTVTATVAVGSSPGFPGQFIVPVLVPSFNSAAQKCQKGIASAGASLVKTEEAALTACFGKLLKSAVKTGKGQPAKALAAAEAKCRADLDPATSSSKVAKAITNTTAKINTGCTGVPLTAIETPCKRSAATLADVESCVVQAAATSAGEAAASQYNDACMLLTLVNLGYKFPGACGVPENF